MWVGVYRSSQLEHKFLFRQPCILTEVSLLIEYGKIFWEDSWLSWSGGQYEPKLFVADVALETIDTSEVEFESPDVRVVEL